MIHRRDTFRGRRAPAALFALLVVTLLAPAASALDLNGFLPEAGAGAVAISYSAESYDEFWAGDTRTSAPPLGEVETTSVNLWLRWGFTDRISLVANVPYVEVDTDGSAGFEDDGLADVEALVLFSALDRTSGAARHRLIAGVGGRTPASSYVADAPVSLGDGSTDILVRIVYQLEVGSFYASQQIGYDSRGDDVPDTFPLYTEAGYTWGRVTGSLFYSRLMSDGGTDIGDPGFTFPSNEEEYSRMGGKAYVRLGGRLGVAASAFTTLDGRNTGDTTGGAAAVVVQF
jgi:hypothetical protein